MSPAPVKMIEGFLKGDDFVLSLIYKQTLPQVKKYVRKNNGGDDDAGDVFQDAILAAWMNINEGKFQVKGTTEIGAYIFQIAKYKWLDKLKSAHHNKTRRLEIVKMEPMEIEASDMPDERMDLMQKMYSLLGDKCKQILGLFYFEKKSLEEMGQLLSYDAATLRTMKYRCMMQLRKMNDETEQ